MTSSRRNYQASAMALALISSLLCLSPLIVGGQQMASRGQSTLTTNDFQSNTSVARPKAQLVSGSASFALPELTSMASECVVRASCKLRLQRQLRPQPILEPQAALDPSTRIVSCYCDNKCNLYDDCCSDAADFATTRASSVSITDNETSDGENVEIIGERATNVREESKTDEDTEELSQQAHSSGDLRHKWHCQRVNGNLGGMQLLAECPANWPDDSPDISVKLAKFIERRCTFVANPNLANNDSLLADYQMDPLGMMMPITDLRTGITFANSYCLRCNRNSRLLNLLGHKSRPKLVSWSPILDCNYDSEHDDRNSLYDLITQHKGNALQYNQQLNKWTVNTKLLEQDAETPPTIAPTTQPLASSDYQSDSSTSQLVAANSERICTIAPSAPEEVRPHLRYCHSNAIRACANSRLARARSAQNRVCRFGPQQLLFSKTSDRVYHNMACALCNGENSTSIDCKPTRRRHMSMVPASLASEHSATSLQKLFPDSLSPFGGAESRSVSPFATSFSILFDLSGPTNAQVPGAVNRCSGLHQVYDPFFMTCRCLICGLNREYREGKCVTKLHMMAENMAFSPMPMRMLPKSYPSETSSKQTKKLPTLSQDSQPSDSEVALNSPQSSDFSKRLQTSTSKQQQIGLQMLIPRDMPETMRPIARGVRTAASKWQTSQTTNTPTNEPPAPSGLRKMTDLDSEYEQILMNLALADLPEPSIESREKFALCGKLTVLPQHYRLFTLSDRLSINSHPTRLTNTSAKQLNSRDQDQAAAATEPETDDTAFMLLNDQDQKHQKRRQARSGTYALRIWAYVKPYNLLLPSSQFELVRPDSVLAEYEMATSDHFNLNSAADSNSLNVNAPSNDESSSSEDERFDLLICAPFRNDLGQKFSLEMAYVTSICLSISIASLTLYLMLYVFSMFNLNRLLKAQREDEQNYHKLSVRSDQTSCSSWSQQQQQQQQQQSANFDNFPESPSILKQLQQAKSHPLSQQQNQQAGSHTPPQRTKRILSEAPSTVGLYSSSSCRRKSLSSQGVACLASSLLAAYLLFILNNVYVANKKDAILSHVPSGQPIAMPATNTRDNQNQVQTDWGCKLMALATIYCFLVAFNWMLLLSYDIWRSVRLATVHLRPPSNNYNGKRFMSYLSFSLVCSASIVGLAFLVDEMPLLCMDESGNFSCSVIEATVNNFVRDFKPHFGYSGPSGVCWFNSRKSLALFFGLPVTIIVVINLIYFLLCSFMVIKTTRRSRNNRTKHYSSTINPAGGQTALRRTSISEQPKFVVHRTNLQDFDSATINPFAGRRPHQTTSDGANLYGSKRSATTMQSSLGNCSYLSNVANGSNIAHVTHNESSSSTSCSTIDDGEITPPIDSLVLANQPQLSMAEIIKAANNNARPPSFEELDAADLAAIYQNTPTQPIHIEQANSTNKAHFRLEPQASSNSLLSNSSSTLGNATSSFATSIAAKYDARKNQLSSMMNTVIQDYRLYCRLSTIMGLTWLIGIMAALVDKSMILWHLFIIFNTLQGLFIFIAFGLKREKLRNVNILTGYIAFRLRKIWARKLVEGSSNNSRKGSL